MRPEYLATPRLVPIPTPAPAPMKIVFVGNVGSGKTTAITSLSESAMLGTEVRATEQDALHRKATTTVGIEYGVMHIHDTKLHLYGTPGQRRFDFMASIACQGAVGMVVMIDNAHPHPLVELDYFLQRHGDYLKTHPAIVAITHYDDNTTQTYLIEYHRYLREHGISCPVMRLDAREKTQVTQVVEKLYAKIIRSRREYP
ncbi:MAG: ATP/GTP-binding protein [Methylovulum sp.]|nr:ATP/GTP-binding protein [Methylovulum sp.]